MTTYRARDKAVVITGASTGIGRACALHLARLGLRVFGGVRKEADAKALQNAASERLLPIFVDVTDSDSVAAAVTQVSESLGRAELIGLVNNAGIALGGPLEFLPIARIRTQLEVNILGQISVTQAFLPLLRKARGRVINMSSISGRVASPLLGPYAASKFALEALSDSLRVELQPWGIEVVCIEPGAIKTPIWEKSLTAADDIIRELPEQAKVLYGREMANLRESTLQTGQQGTPPEAVARAVEHALLSKRPKTRYLVGRDAKIGAFLTQILPDRWRDWLFTHFR